MRIFSGDIKVLTDEDKFIKIVSGSVEVYAATKSEENFYREFLMKRESGDFIFPANDEFERINISIYALKDTEIEFLTPTLSLIHILTLPTKRIVESSAVGRPLKKKRK